MNSLAGETSKPFPHRWHRAIADRRETPMARGLTRLVGNRLAAVGLAILLSLFFCAAAAPYITAYSPTEMDVAHRFQPPGFEHLMGTDQFGRDLLTRILYGARISLSVGLVSVGIAAILGTFVGLLSGYYVGWLDLIVGRVMDVFFAFPAILLAIAIMAVLGQNLTNVMIAIGVVTMPIFARVVRASAIRIRNLDYIEAAVSIGESDERIILCHILPNCLPALIVQTTVAFAWAIMAESALSFLGLGARPPTPSWGLILNEGRNVLEYAPWQAVFAGVTIMVAVFSLNVLGDGLQDALDPAGKIGRSFNH
jgi:peptide/nickel transport system permease protein